MNVIITGVSRGIGYQLVKKFSRENHHVIAISRNLTGLNQLHEECMKENEACQVHLIDLDLLTIQDDHIAKNLLLKIIDKMPHVDILINNAATLIQAPFMELSRKDFQQSFDINFFSVIAFSQLLIPLMGAKRQGHIVNISTMGAVEGSVKFPGLSAYGTSKAALNSLTECMSLELIHKNIAVNCLALGAVQTEMLKIAFPHYKAPLTAEQMAEYITQFALTGQKYFNGKILHVSTSTP